MSSAGYDTYVFSTNPYMGAETNMFQGFDVVEHPWKGGWKPVAQAVLESKLIERDASTTVSPAWPRKASRTNNYLFKEAAPVASMALRQWVGQRSDLSRPWFAFVNLMEAHLPRVPSMQAREKMMTPELIERGFQVTQTSASLHAWMAGEAELSEEDLAAIQGVYDASLVDLDAATGAMFEAMEQEGLLDNTVVVVTSDHGEALGEHGLMLHKYGVYAHLARVPLIVVAPGRLEPGRRDELVSVSDTMRLVAEIAGLDSPVVDVWGGGERPPGEVVEFNAVASHSIEQLQRAHRGVDVSLFRRTFRGIELGAEKLIVGSDGSRQLYRYQDDPAEAHDLFGQMPAEAEALDAALGVWLGSFEHFDPEGSQEPEVPMSPELGEALRILGYLEGDGEVVE